MKKAKTIKTIIVSCGSGIATSAACATRLNMELEKRGLDQYAVAEPVGISSLKTALQQADVYVCIIPYYLNNGNDEFECKIPVVNGVGLLTGLKKDECVDEVVKALNLD